MNRAIFYMADTGGGTLDLKSGWDKLWTTLTGGTQIGTLLAAVGIAIVVGFLIKWFWDKRRGSGGKFPTMAVILGAVLAGPTLLVPVIITVVEAVINLGINIITAIVGML